MRGLLHLIGDFVETGVPILPDNAAFLPAAASGSTPARVGIFRVALTAAAIWIS
jgi:hypothetical protein